MFRGGSEGESEPEWVQNEKEQFSTYRDKDGDGFMDQEEVTIQLSINYKLFKTINYKFFSISIFQNY